MNSVVVIGRIALHWGRAEAVIAMALTAASYALVTPHFATSLALGAFLEAVNLGAIHRAARKLFAGEMMSGGWVGGLALRFLLLGTAIYLTLAAGADPVAFVARCP